MKRLTGIIMGLSLLALLSFGLTLPSQSEQATESVQDSHADTW
ncbi:TPA: Phr family secreted Rap phosphatase inhibitor [Bacillus pseudomycoides]|nr:Phr family secreted Rap phosphatase inhibitor [Bacillus pseudomycoides]